MITYSVSLQQHNPESDCPNGTDSVIIFFETEDKNHPTIKPFRANPGFYGVFCQTGYTVLCCELYSNDELWASGD